VFRDGERAAAAFTRVLRGAASIAAPARPGAPCPYNVPIGSGRRYTWVERPLDEVRAVRRVLGGTLNDVVLSAVAGALRRHLLRRGEDPATLRAMVPVSVRDPGPAGELGNRVTSLFGSLPVDVADPLERLAEVRAMMGELKRSDQGEGGQALMAAGDLAPPPLLGVGARRFASPRLFNLTVTNIPGPQVPLYLLGREMVGLHPIVPLAPDHALGVAILSFNGRLSFGLLGDFDALWDLDDLAADVGDALDELLDAVGRPAFEEGGVTLLRR
jgi:WS/DGAT/MGAT family acyltransferase